jgi:hypothetical protein
VKAVAWKRQGAHQTESREKAPEISDQNAFLGVSRRNAPSENSIRLFRAIVYRSQ